MRIKVLKVKSSCFYIFLSIISISQYFITILKFIFLYFFSQGFCLFYSLILLKTKKISFECNIKDLCFYFYKLRL